MKQRNLYFDYLKGLAIMGVVAIHTIKFNYDVYSLMGVVVATFRNLLGCCVPLFVALSGYFLYNKKIETKSAYANFMKDRLSSVYYPMLVWGLPWLLLGFLSVNSIKDITYLLIFYFTGGLSLLYFISLIIELYALLPVVQRVDKKSILLYVFFSIAVTFGWSLVIYVYNIYPPFIVYSSFPTHIVFFALGCYLRKRTVTLSLRSSILLTCAALAFSVVESYFWLDFNPKCNWLGLKASVQILSLALILLLFSPRFSEHYKSTKYKKWIELLGSQSMPIYMSHLLLLLVFKKLGFHPDLWIVNWGLIMALDTLFVFILARFMPKRVLPYLGIRI